MRENSYEEYRRRNRWWRRKLRKAWRWFSDPTSSSLQRRIRELEDRVEEGPDVRGGTH